jgi:hypothetical protein
MGFWRRREDMPVDPKKPNPGDFVVDASEVSGFVKDYAPGEVGKQREKPGIDLVVAEVQAFLARPAEERAEAGLDEADMVKALAQTDKINQIKKFLPAVLKLAEMLEETKNDLEDQREGCISDVAASVDRRAKRKGTEGLVAQFEETRKYRSSVAVKAAKTRKRNAAAEDGTPEEPTSGS